MITSRTYSRRAASSWTRLLGGGAVGSGGSGGGYGGGAPLHADPSTFILLLSVAGAVIGYLRGAGREFWSLAITAVTYFVIEFQWPLVTHWVNWVWSQLFSQPLIPPGVETPVWQMAFFVLGVLIAYLFSQRIAAPPSGGALELLNIGNMISRVTGAFFGAATGFIVGVFTLSRLVTGPGGALAPGSVARQVLGDLTVPVLFVGFVILVVFGVLSLGGRGKKVYS